MLDADGAAETVKESSEEKRKVESLILLSEKAMILKKKRLDRQDPRHIKTFLQLGYMSLTTALTSPSCPMVPDAYQKRTQTTRLRPPPRAVICGVTSSGEIVENLDDDVAGDGSNDKPEVVLAHGSPGFPLAVKPRRRCTSLDPGTAAAIKPCDARAKGTAAVGHRRITERRWTRDARFLVLGVGGAGEACGATPPPWD